MPILEDLRARCASTRLIVGLLVGLPLQHSFTNSQVPLPNPISSALPGFFGRDPFRVRNGS